MEENIKESSLSTMDKLKAIKRLRLFYSTDEEFINFAGKQIKSNGFNKLTEKRKEELYRSFTKDYIENLCVFTKKYPRFAYLVLESTNINTFLQLYESTSNFYMENKKEISMIRDSDSKKTILFLDCILEDTIINDQTIPKDILNLCEKYKENRIYSSAILLLLILELIPAFDKRGDDIENINTDFQILINEITDYLLYISAKKIKIKVNSYIIKSLSSICKKEIIRRLKNTPINRFTLYLFANTALEICSSIKSKGIIATVNAIRNTNEDYFSRTKLDGLWEVIKGNGKEFYELQRINATYILLKHYTFKRDYINKDREYELYLLDHISNNKYSYGLFIEKEEEEVNLSESFNCGSLQIEINKTNNEYLLIFENESLLGEVGFTLKQSQAGIYRYQPYLNKYNNLHQQNLDKDNEREWGIGKKNRNS